MEITSYEQLKELPKEQKAEALKELLKKYETFRGISNAIGGYAVVYQNMYNKEVKGISTRTKKNDVDGLVVPKRTRKSKVQPVETKDPQTFITSLSGEYSGEESKERISGLSSALLANKNYSLVIKIVEL